MIQVIRTAPLSNKMIFVTNCEHVKFELQEIQ